MPSPNRDCCEVCGRPVAHHWDNSTTSLKRVWIGCMGARRGELIQNLNEALEALTPEPQEPPRPIHVPTRARQFWNRIVQRWRN